MFSSREESTPMMAISARKMRYGASLHAERRERRTAFSAARSSVGGEREIGAVDVLREGREVHAERCVRDAHHAVARRERRANDVPLVATLLVAGENDRSRSRSVEICAAPCPNGRHWVHSLFHVLGVDQVVAGDIEGARDSSVPETAGVQRPFG